SNVLVAYAKSPRPASIATGGASTVPPGTKSQAIAMATTAITAERENYLNQEYGIKSWLLTTDHKRIALLYLVSITFFFFVGGFFFLIPSIPAVLGNFLVPLMIGAKDLAFPRINLLSWYLFIIAGIVMLHCI